MSVLAWTYVFVGLTFSLYLAIAWLSRVKDTRGFYVAGRGIPAAVNGMATGADWMSAASFLSMAGLISMMGYAGGVYLMGWTGGFVLLALLLAPYLRKFGHFTVPDFIGDRYESSTARIVAVVCAVFVSFVYVTGQMRGVGVVFARFLEVDINVGVIIGMTIVFVYATLGGMKGITWTQAAQYWVLITAFLVPAIAISFRLTGQAIPSVGMGSTLSAEGVHLLERLNQIHADLGFASYTEPFAHPAWNRLNVFCTALALMVGTAGLPHVIVRFYTVRTVGAARWSAFWALLFIGLLYLTAPATAAFARYYMIESLQGRTAGGTATVVPQLGADRPHPVARRWRRACEVFESRRQRDLPQRCADRRAAGGDPRGARAPSCGRRRRRRRPCDHARPGPERTGYRHHRAGHARDGGPVQLDHRARRGRRAGRSAVDGQRPAAGDLVQHRARPVLPDHRSRGFRGEAAASWAGR
jgi:probable sodium:solute symporter